jgi:soluble lytic murein transglycosylase-like protein
LLGKHLRVIIAILWSDSGPRNGKRMPQIGVLSREGSVSMRRGFQFVVCASVLSPALFAADGIVPVREGNRVIFKNNESAPASSITGSSCESASPRRYLYWSNTDKRWKRIPAPSKVAIRNACSAMQEVNAAVASVPQSKTATKRRPNAAPDTRVLTYGRSISQPQLDALIEDAAQRHNVDPNLVRSMIRVESNFNTRAVSRKGALGLMQLMPATARELNVKNPLDPAQNVDGGVRHLKGLLNEFNGDIQLSLAAYNAGEGAVKRKGGIPNYKETRNYVKRISELYGGTNAAGAGRSQIRVSVDAEGRRIYTND